MILVQDLLRLDDNSKDITDGHIRTSCPACKTGLTLADAHVLEEDPGTVYRCPGDSERVVIVGRRLDPDTRPRNWGYRIGNFILRNATDLYVQTPQMGSNSVLFPASEAAMRDI